MQIVEFQLTVGAGGGGDKHLNKFTLQRNSSTTKKNYIRLYQCTTGLFVGGEEEDDDDDDEGGRWVNDKVLLVLVVEMAGVVVGMVLWNRPVCVLPQNT